MTLGCNKNNS